MWVTSCFDGDDLTLAWAQHEVYFTHGHDEFAIDGRSSVGYLWFVTADRLADLVQSDPWVYRHAHRVRRLGSFHHRLLQEHHAHIAAYYRWQLRDGPKPAADGGPPSRELLKTLAADWIRYLRVEVPALLADPATLLTLAKLFVYRNFDAGDAYDAQFAAALEARYGFECMATSWRGQQRAAGAGRA